MITFSAIKNNAIYKSRVFTRNMINALVPAKRQISGIDQSVFSNKIYIKSVNLMFLISKANNLLETYECGNNSPLTRAKLNKLYFTLITRLIILDKNKAIKSELATGSADLLIRFSKFFMREILLDPDRNYLSRSKQSLDLSKNIVLSNKDIVWKKDMIKRLISGYFGLSKRCVTLPVSKKDILELLGNDISVLENIISLPYKLNALKLADCFSGKRLVLKKELSGEKKGVSHLINELFDVFPDCDNQIILECKPDFEKRIKELKKTGKLNKLQISMLLKLSNKILRDSEYLFFSSAIKKSFIDFLKGDVFRKYLPLFTSSDSSKSFVDFLEEKGVCGYFSHREEIILDIISGLPEFKDGLIKLFEQSVSVRDLELGRDSLDCINKIFKDLKILGERGRYISPWWQYDPGNIMRSELYKNYNKIAEVVIDNRDTAMAADCYLKSSEIIAEIQTPKRRSVPKNEKIECQNALKDIAFRLLSLIINSDETKNRSVYDIVLMTDGIKRSFLIYFTLFKRITPKIAKEIGMTPKDEINYVAFKDFEEQDIKNNIKYVDDLKKALGFASGYWDKFLKAAMENNETVGDIAFGTFIMFCMQISCSFEVPGFIERLGIDNSPNSYLIFNDIAVDYILNPASLLKAPDTTNIADLCLETSFGITCILKKLVETNNLEPDIQSKFLDQIDRISGKYIDLARVYLFGMVDYEWALNHLDGNEELLKKFFSSGKPLKPGEKPKSVSPVTYYTQELINNSKYDAVTKAKLLEILKRCTDLCNTTKAIHCVERAMHLCYDGDFKDLPKIKGAKILLFNSMVNLYWRLIYEGDAKEAYKWERHAFGLMKRIKNEILDNLGYLDGTSRMSSFDLPGIFKTTALRMLRCYLNSTRTISEGVVSTKKVLEAFSYDEGLIDKFFEIPYEYRDKPELLFDEPLSDNLYFQYYVDIDYIENFETMIGLESFDFNLKANLHKLLIQSENTREKNIAKSAKRLNEITQQMLDFKNIIIEASTKEDKDKDSEFLKLVIVDIWKFAVYCLRLGNNSESVNALNNVKRIMDSMGLQHHYYEKENIAEANIEAAVLMIKDLHLGRDEQTKMIAYLLDNARSILKSVFDDSRKREYDKTGLNKKAVWLYEAYKLFSSVCQAKSKLLKESPAVENNDGLEDPGNLVGEITGILTGLKKEFAGIDLKEVSAKNSFNERLMKGFTL